MTEIISAEFVETLMETEHCFHADTAIRMSIGQTCPELSCLLPTDKPRAWKYLTMDKRYVAALEWLHSA